MGAKLAEFFTRAQRLGGVSAELRFTELVRTTALQAKHEPDTPVRLAAFEAALARVGSSPASAPVSGGREQQRRLSETVMSLVSDSALFATGKAADAITRITEAGATALQVARSSVWQLTPQGDAISCLDLFEHASRTHASGAVLGAAVHAAYFDALRLERTIAAHEARTDPRTSSFAAGYLVPLGISSMLDVPIWRGGRMRGVICLEHVGPPRRWTDHEENFCYSVAGIVGLILDGDPRFA